MTPRRGGLPPRPSRGTGGGVRDEGCGEPCRCPPGAVVGLGVRESSSFAAVLEAEGGFGELDGAAWLHWLPPVRVAAVVKNTEALCGMAVPASTASTWRSSTPLETYVACRVRGQGAMAGRVLLVGRGHGEPAWCATVRPSPSAGRRRRGCCTGSAARPGASHVCGLVQPRDWHPCSAGGSRRTRRRSAAHTAEARYAVLLVASEPTRDTGPARRAFRFRTGPRPEMPL